MSFLSFFFKVCFVPLFILSPFLLFPFLSLPPSLPPTHYSHLAVARLHRDHPLRAVGPVDAHAVALPHAAEQGGAGAHGLDAGADLGVRLPLVVPGLIIFLFICVFEERMEDNSRFGREKEKRERGGGEISISRSFFPPFFLSPCNQPPRRRPPPPPPPLEKTKKSEKKIQSSLSPRRRPRPPCSPGTGSPRAPAPTCGTSRAGCRRWSRPPRRPRRATSRGPRATAPRRRGRWTKSPRPRAPRRSRGGGALFFFFWGGDFLMLIA